VVATARAPPRRRLKPRRKAAPPSLPAQARCPALCRQQYGSKCERAPWSRTISRKAQTDAHFLARLAPSLRRALAAIGASSLILVFIAVLAFHAPPQRAAHASYSLVGARQYYLSLGDSLAYGYQPNEDYNDGYAQDFYGYLQSQGMTEPPTYYGCTGATTTEMVSTPGCSGLVHDSYPSHNGIQDTQLQAAVAFIQQYPGEVSPVTLDIGGDDLNLSHSNSTCEVNNDQQDNTSFGANLAKMDQNLTQYILPQLVQVLNGTGDLIVLNYHDHFDYSDPPSGTTAPLCPNAVAYTQQENEHIAADVAQVAQQFGVQIPVVDIYSQFPPRDLCAYTWWCSSYQDLHPNNIGYQVMANTIINAGY
jgi:lysophospholipase L1-like esterase